MVKSEFKGGYTKPYLLFLFSRSVDLIKQFLYRQRRDQRHNVRQQTVLMSQR